jgi:hypothetical protein
MSSDGKDISNVRIMLHYYIIHSDLEMGSGSGVGKRQKVDLS